MSPSQSPSNSTPPQPTRILIADRNRMGNQLLSESLGHDPRFEIVAVATAANVLPIVATRHPHVALISADLEAGTRKGLQVARNLNSRHPSINIVMLLETGAPESVIAAFRCGAGGVFSRTDPLSELPACIERVSRGEIGASRNQARFLLEALRSAPSCEGITGAQIELLSHRELQVAEHAAQGQSNKQIADQLGLSEHTVKNYLFHVFEKLGVSNRCELLFLLFKECNGQATGRGRASFDPDIGESITTYLKDADEGVVAAQFMVGIAHLEGYGVEKDDRSAYYWLRMAEENSCTIQHRSHALVEELRSTVKTHDIEAVEHSVALAIQENELLRRKRPGEFIKPSVKSGSLETAQEFSTGTEVEGASLRGD